MKTVHLIVTKSLNLFQGRTLWWRWWMDEREETTPFIAHATAGVTK